MESIPDKIVIDKKAWIGAGSRILSKDFPHVRVDFYDIDGTIVFGELTFHSGSGYTPFGPDEFDFMMGDKFILPQKTID